MAYMRFRNRLGRELFERLEPRLDWLSGSLAVRTLQGAERRRVEEELIAFLLLMRYNEGLVRDGRGMDMLEYVRDTLRMNHACYKLLHGQEPLSLEFETPKGVIPVQLGYAEGVTMAAPLTGRGYDDYAKRRIWGLEFRDEHIEPLAADGRTRASFAFVGTVFHVPALPRLHRDDGTDIFTHQMPNHSVRLIAQVYRQIARCIPAVQYDERTGRYTADGPDPDALPTIICSADGDIGEGLLPRAGFAIGGDSGISKVGLPMYELRLADLNDDDLDPERRERIELTLRILDRFAFTDEDRN